jgi:hypothetical protein
MRAVAASASMPVRLVLSASCSGIRAKKRPEPHPGSRIGPPAKPMRSTARQTARITNSGV